MNKVGYPFGTASRAQPDCGSPKILYGGNGMLRLRVILVAAATVALVSGALAENLGFRYSMRSDQCLKPGKRGFYK